MRDAALAGSRSRYRILYHHRTQALDGQRVHIHEIQRALRALGHDVLEVAPLESTNAAGTEASLSWGHRLADLAARCTPKGAYEALELSYNAAAYLRLSAAIRRFKPDFIYERYALNTTAGVWASKRFGIPLLLEVNSPLAEEKKRLGQLLFHRLAARLEGYVIRNATRSLAVTGVLKRIVVDATGVPEDRVLVIHNGVDVTRFHAAADPCARDGSGDDRVTIGAIGFFREWHGIDLLLRAVAAQPLLAQRTRVVLVGDGPAVPSLRRLCRALGLDDRVVFAGSVPHQEVPRLMAAMDVVLMPRAVEYASPLKLFEYMAAQKAIVAPRQSNLQEILTDGVDALFFSPEDAGDLQSALVNVVADHQLRRRIGRQARETIQRKNLTWDGNAARIIAVFDELRHVSAVAPAWAGSHA